MPARSTATALSAAAVTLTAGLFTTGCQVAPLPEGYSWNVRHVNEIDHPTASGPRHRRGFAATAVDRTNASTNRGGKAYNFASALPGHTTRSSGQAATAPAADLSPPRSDFASSAPQNLFAEEDPAAELFGSPVPGPSGLRVELAPARTLPPTPATGRAPDVASHTIVRGDNLWSLAQRYYGSGLRYQDLLRANPGIDPGNLKLGDRLVLPGIAPGGR